MNVGELRKYWSAYTDAWKLMKNRQMVNSEHVVQMVKKHENPIMNRLFCLVVWQEIKRIKSGGFPLQDKQYEECFTGAWKLFKKYNEPIDSDEYWNGLVDMIGAMSKEYGNCSFITNLLIHATLEELERIWRTGK
ncbi:hypothetical protein [Clostridium sp. E02]|uniref:hypothetical protein n=1 Tax=Clostridium sp. E02 TaxID=2487134 RepID=UPI000F54BD9C|nr:hypothetical protein [Clostridium sp. E02]